MTRDDLDRAVDVLLAIEADATYKRVKDRSPWGGNYEYYSLPVDSMERLKELRLALERVQFRRMGQTG